MIPCPIVIVWSGDDRAYSAAVPDLRSCSARGEVPEAALGEIRVALDLGLEAPRERGIPAPRSGRVAAVLDPAR